MSDNANTAMVRAYEKLRETIQNLPADGGNSAHVNQLRADSDAFKQELEDSGAFPLKEQRSNGSADKDEPIEHTEDYFDRSNDWLGYADGGQLTRTVNSEKEDEQKAREKKEADSDKHLDEMARNQKADEVSNSADQRKVK